jgi:hypothetical protein
MLQTILFVTLLTAMPAGIHPSPPARQDEPPARGRPGRAAGAILSPVEVINMLDAYAIVQAQDALQLNDGQYGEFVTRLRRLHQTRRQAQQERHRLIQQLRRLAGPQATQVDENAIRTNIKALRDLDERSSIDVRKAYDAVDEVLDPRQQARFRLFEERLEARKLDLLMRARQGAATQKR